MDGAHPDPAPENKGEITRLLELAGGDGCAAGALFDRLYPELHRLARSRMRSQPAGHTLNTTGLVHEAYLRLVGREGQSWAGRKQFFAHAARVMRSVLVDHARRRVADKRDAGRRTTLTGAALPVEFMSLDLMSLDVALEELQAIDAERARVIELVVFGGLNLEEVAEVLELSHSTVRRRWRVVRSWLQKQLEPGAGTDTEKS